MDRTSLELTFASLMIAVGLMLGGAFVGMGFAKGRGEATVTVKGLAEQFVTADLVVWPLRVTATGDSLAAVQAKIDQDLEAIIAFLAERGIAPDAVQPQRVEVTDILAQPYRPEGAGANRFIVAQTIIVRTTEVDLVAELNRQTGELVRRDIVLIDTGGPTYLFTRLNEIKPAMLALATKSARASAEQFAADADSEIEGIRHADQGIFQILPRDPAPGIMEQNQIEKQVRVVSTIVYRLDD